MYTSEDVLEGARSIRPMLSELLGLNAPDVDNLLADLLTAAEGGDKVDNKVLDLLARNDATRLWMRDYLRADEKDAFVVRGYSPPPGPPGPVSAHKYVCPYRDYTWYQRSVGQPVPKCPTHGVELVNV